MAKIPKWLLTEIVSCLDLPSIAKLCTTCKDFYKASIPSLFRFVTLNQSMGEEYQNFLVKRGLYVRELKITRLEDFIKFREHNLSLSTSFPGLQALYLDMEFFPQSVDLEDLTYECIALKELKHLHIYGERLWNGLLACLKPLIKTLDSLYVEFYPYTIIECPYSFYGLKLLLMPLSEAKCIRKTTMYYTIPFEIALVDAHAPIILLNLEANCSKIWLQCERDNAQYFLKLSSDNQFRGNKLALEKGRFESIFLRAILQHQML
ncbi:hypothetical protein DSO57_1007288 [Entomophthora muscae]|uniref:Uncharacterized protein n=1 Tax=Entomophthora muscae TaxID=34485 RepID=A0ACC2UU29_9FUNG|nr:hypothetical protein DSO57_1007288 [Entomophthora muscae]